MDRPIDEWEPPDRTYPAGYARMMARLERFEGQYADLHGVLPRADHDLEAAERRLVAAPEAPSVAKPKDLRDKRQALAAEFAGRPELLLDHALLIAVLRRAPVPDHVPALFGRIWREGGRTLARELSTRWLVSAATTFADHGETEAQRSAGLALLTLFGLMKLYESERLYSGTPPDVPFPFGSYPDARPPLGLGRYSVGGGDLDLNLLGRIWREGEADEAVRPLAAALLHRLNDAPDTVFRRFILMRRALPARRRPRPQDGT